MMSANVAATMRKALCASLSLATSEFVADLPHAQRDAAEIRVALAWLEQNCSTVFNTPTTTLVYAGRIVHEGIRRWPRYGARGKRGTIAKAVAWSGYFRQ